MTDNISKNKKVFKGVVVSDRADKTVIVAVNRLKTHPKYLKKYRLTKKYKVHDQENKCKEGDVIEFAVSRPVSKGKNFKVI